MLLSTKSISLRLHIFLFASFFLIYGANNVIAKSNDEDQTINIGAIVHVDSQVGREQKTAMDRAVAKFNANSKNQTLSIHYKNGSSKTPLQSAFSAQELIEQKQVQVIISTREWQETTLLADVGNRFRVPIISLLAPDINPPFVSLKWPYLIQMGINGSEQIQCIADLVRRKQWRRVIVIYENEPYGGDSGSLILLSKALLDLGSQIEYVLSLPPLTSDPKEAVKEEISKFINKKCYSRVFVVLHLSQTLASHLFAEAKDKGLTGKESVWIITQNSSRNVYLGLKTDSNLSFNALQAYDAVIAIGNAANKFPRNNTSEMLKSILSIDFLGLSGRIYFEEGRLASQKRSCKDLVQVSPNEVAHKGWEMPTTRKKMRIGIPTRHAFTNFVDVVSKHNYTGFCIELFREAVKILPYDLPVEFVAFPGPYSELVDSVYNKTYDAAVGDFTSLANRTDYVEFTEPFAESGLAMILPAKPDFKNKGWIFLRPFKIDLWIATFGILIYTMLIVWFLEHRINPEFRGSWKDQFSTAMWFTFSSIFFAQRENIQSSYTRAVLLVWFFVVLVLTQSYTADLSSMLTAARLQQNETDIQTLVTKNAKVGYFNQSFIGEFLTSVLKFKNESIVPIDTDFKYFNGNFTEEIVTAAFLEIPYARLFKNNYCDDYTMTISNYRFGGLSFVFPKGSPIAIDVSRAILDLTENGNLTNLEKTWLNGNEKCSANETDWSNNNDTESLTLKSFWGLFVVSAATSTLCLLGYLIDVIRKYRQYHRESDRILNGLGETPLSFTRYVIHGDSRNLTINIRSNNGASSTRRKNWFFRGYEIRDSV